MKDKRFWLGILATSLWLCYAGHMLSTHSHPSQLSQWGDFFAGFFAPLAFLWLVIGYLQQGDELKQSTQALRLQAEELRNSVEQQSQLVAVGREQMKQQFDVIQEERELRRSSARPKFVPQHNGSIISSGKTTHKLKLMNVGNIATSVSLTFEPGLEAQSSVNHALIPRNEAVEIHLRFGQATQSLATLNYFDADGIPGEVQFTVQVPAAGGLQFGEVERVL